MRLLLPLPVQSQKRNILTVLHECVVFLAQGVCEWLEHKENYEPVDMPDIPWNISAVLDTEHS